MINSKMLRGILCALLTLTLFGDAYGQFKKFRSKTNYNRPKDGSVDSGQPPEDFTEGVSDDGAEPQDGYDDNAEANNDRDPLDDQPLDDDSPPSFGNRPSGNDSFGRNKSISEIKIDTRSKKYVNLNPETAFGPEVVDSFDYPDISILELTKRMQKLTGINLILDKDVKGKISILAPSPITVGDAWKAYLTALNLGGYTLVKSGAFYKIVNARDIRYTPTKIYTGSYTPDTENYVMRILPLKNISSTEVTRSFRPFMSRYGRIIDIKQTNTIIVQDTGSNINRLVRLIKFVDVPGHEETLQIIPVKNSSAQEIAKLLDTILKGKGSGSFKGGAASKSSPKDISKIIAEPRTNSIIAMANAQGAKQLRSLIHKLDVKYGSKSSGQIHVYYLNYGDAETLSKTLSGLVGGASKPSRSGGSQRSNRFSEGSSSLFNSEVKITGDKDNNALVVTASPTDYQTIRSVIKKLDIPRDQVYVEGLIMETNVSRGRGWGISIFGAYGTGGAQRGGFTGNSGGQDLTKLFDPSQFLNLNNFFGGFGIGKKIEVPGPGGSNITVNSVNGLIRAIANNSATNVLATPQILALDNTEASFEVGETVPVEERTLANNQTQVSVKQQQVKLALKITPQINKVTRFIKLKIDQNIEDFSGRTTSTTGGGVATTVRGAVTTVVVRDQDTIAMGGLMRDREVNDESKVPLLGDIPVLGWLFKHKNTSIEKINLLMFLTPKILSPYGKQTASTVKDLLNRRISHLKDEVEGQDPFLSTSKNLYEKAKKQEQGVLYNEEEAQRYRRQNENPKGNSVKAPAPAPASAPTSASSPVAAPVPVPAQKKQVPNYKDIANLVKNKKQTVITKQAALKK